jgi:hypothetical protein
MDLVLISDSTCVFKTGKKNHPIGGSRHFESVFPNATVSAKCGATGKELMEAMVLNLDEVQTKDCRELSAE